ncbi:MAG TPA: NTP transferase domain-containing protein [Solirubrobacteraceae bacterium]|jgi:2-phospho-L-lactate guanylyltransferase
MRTAAILPVKRFAQAKQRLGASVADPLRLQLARAMVGDVLAALAETAAIELTIVVTGEPSVAETARAAGAVMIDDTVQDGQSAAVCLGVRHALDAGVERVLCIPGDCPTLDPVELENLLGSPRDRHSGSDTSATRASEQSDSLEGRIEVVIVPDRHGSGTNGLLLAPPDAIPPSFGPDSRERHTALALATGIAARIEQPPSLLLDIDTGDDLAVLRDRLSGERVRASRTRAALGLPANPSALSATTPA